ncbi:MAG: methyl-accepting chemotaxis protein [Chromatiales bacterium]
MKERANLQHRLKAGFFMAAVVSTAFAGTAAMLVAQSCNAPTSTQAVIATVITSTLLWAVLGAAGWVYLRRLSRPLARLKGTIMKIAEGDLLARTGLRGSDEFSQIGQTLDTILEEQRTTGTRFERENEQLNDSIVALLETVAQLAEKNLAIRAQVSEDVTGPIADALNLMTSETARVLREVTRISSEVAEASNLVKSQSDMVTELASYEYQEIEQTADQLAVAADTMTKIAKLAQMSSKFADQATQTTHAAVETVSASRAGMDRIRETIRETGRLIKRLSERSQEIGEAVNLIDGIAERTHILALNASMHAAAAGEAGRGFAVVAEEVKRLAESAREATSKVSALVSNVQAETADSMTTVNNAISEVVDGSDLTEKAAEKMTETQHTTQQLVSIVQKIAMGAVAQARNSQGLRERTDHMMESVRQTGEHMRVQTSYTDQLVEYAMALVESVGVFQLPDEEAEAA